MKETTQPIEERNLFTAIILAGICANYQNTTPCPLWVEDAVYLADSLITILKKNETKM